MGRSVMGILAVVLLLGACGNGDQGNPDTNPADNGNDQPVANACPAEGCRVEIVDVAAEGEELRVTLDANFLPDMSRNHVHVFWDLYTADQVSDDAEARGAEQGDWLPLDSYPEFVTEGAASVSARGDSTGLCVTAADRDHMVLDSSMVDCRDVADLLG